MWDGASGCDGGYRWPCLRAAPGRLDWRPGTMQGPGAGAEVDGVEGEWKQGCGQRDVPLGDDDDRQYRCHVNGALGLALSAEEGLIESQVSSGPLEIMALMVGPVAEVYGDARSWPAGRVLG